MEEKAYGRIDTLPSVRRMEYHTERTLRVRCEPSTLLAIVLVGIFFVVGVYLSH